MSDSTTQPLDLNMEVNEDLDQTVEEEINRDATEADTMNIDGAADAEPVVNGIAEPAQTFEARIPAKKDATLREFLGKMDEYAPIVCWLLLCCVGRSMCWQRRQIPDAVTNYYLTRAGLPPPPQTSPHLARLLALATQKFIADIAADAYQFSRIRSSNTTSNNPMGGLAAGGPQGAAAPGGAQGGKDSGAKAKDYNLGIQRPGYGGGGQGGSQGRTVLTMEDLGMAVGEYGVNIKRGEFYRWTIDRRVVLIPRSQTQKVWWRLRMHCRRLLVFQAQEVMTWEHHAQRKGWSYLYSIGTGDCF
jgi:transcription initiation factor TFIID subunit 10